MSEVLRKRQVQIVLILVTAACISVAGLNMYSGDTEAKAEKFDWGLFKSIYRSMEANAVASVDDLIGKYDSDMVASLPIAPPDPDVPLEVGENRSTLLKTEKFSAGLLAKLMPVQRQINGRKYIAYPMTVRENPKSREHVVQAADGSIIAQQF